MTRSREALRALAVCLLALACERGTAPPPAPVRDEPTHRADHVAVSQQQRAALGIEVAPAAPGRVDAPVELLGEVVPNGDHLAHIVPRFPGIAREVRKVAGDEVRAGDVLAVIESSESLVRYDLRTL